MGKFTHFGESLALTSTSTNVDDEASILAVLILVALSFLFTAVIYLSAVLSLMQIFKKAGVKPWIAWVPFYNSWKMLEIGGQAGYWAVLSIIPFVSIVSAVFTYISMYHISKKLGKDDSFIIWGIFLPLVWYIWLAVDKSQWNDAASTAPSLAK